MDEKDMDEKDFILLSRYEIRPAINLVVDRMLQKETRLEPRLMKLLCLLAEQPGQLVSREKLVKEIWDDYGGGEAGLTHAVSSLRKLLNDTSRELIETVPTRGYILHAERLGPNTAPAQPRQPKALAKRPVLYGAAAVVVVFAVYFLSRIGTGGKETAAAPQKEIAIPFEAVSGKPEETWRNTIVTTGRDSTVYKLKVVGDGRPEFYINGVLLSPDEMEKHLDLINSLKKKLRERNE